MAAQHITHGGARLGPTAPSDGGTRRDTAITKRNLPRGIAHPMRRRHFVEKQQDVVRVALGQLASPVDYRRRDPGVTSRSRSTTARRWPGSTATRSRAGSTTRSWSGTTTARAWTGSAARGRPRSTTARAWTGSAASGRPRSATARAWTGSAASGRPCSTAARPRTGSAARRWPAAAGPRTGSLSGWWLRPRTALLGRLAAHDAVELARGLRLRRAWRKDADRGCQKRGQGRASDDPIVHISPAPRPPAGR